MTDTVTITGTVDGRDAERIRRQLLNIIGSMRRTWPGSRALGLSGSQVDAGPPLAATYLAMDLQGEVDKWMPGISIKEVRAQSNVDGTNAFTVEVEWV